MRYVKDRYTVSYKNTAVGYYSVFNDGSAEYNTAWGSPWDMEEELKALKLDKEMSGKKAEKLFSNVICDENRVPGRKRIIYRKDSLVLERRPEETGERFSVDRRNADRKDQDYSDLRSALRGRKDPGRHARMGFVVRFQPDG